MSQNDKPTVLIIGAGFGGLGCARQFVKNGWTVSSTSNNDNDTNKGFNIILVEQKDFFSIGGTWQFVWNSRLTLEDTKFPLSQVDLPGVDVRLKTTVSQWSPQDKTVTLESLDNNDNSNNHNNNNTTTTVSYDYIVLSPGVVPDPTDIPGIETSVNICFMGHVEQQKKDMEELVRQAKTKKMTFCLAIGVEPYKCPPAPFELILLVDEYVRKAGVRDNVRFVLTCPVEFTMPPETKPIVLGCLKEKEIEYLPNKALEKVEDSKLFFKDGSDPLKYDCLWSVWPIRAPDFVQESGLPINSSGTVDVGNRVTNAIENDKAPGAYIIGDACRVPFGQTSVPKAGEFAWKMGISVAQDIGGQRQPADRAGKCAAEAGFGKGIVLSPNFSDVCNNPENGKPTVEIELADDGTDQKVAWVNGYLQDIFGDNVEPLMSKITRVKKKLKVNK